MLCNRLHDSQFGLIHQHPDEYQNLSLKVVIHLKSRVSINPSNAVNNFSFIVRRLYRLFSHTYYNHREIYDEFEVRFSYK